jgi:hypothetical protein
MRYNASSGIQCIPYFAPIFRPVGVKHNAPAPQHITRRFPAAALPPCLPSASCRVRACTHRLYGLIGSGACKHVPYTLQLKLIEIGARIVRHARAITFQLAEVAVTGVMVRAILVAIRRLRAPPLCA